MKRYVYSLGAVMLVGSCMPALAQRVYVGSDSGDVPVNVYFAGGEARPTGEAANFVDNGYNLGFGVQWRPHPGPISLRLDFEYSHNKATSQLLSEGEAFTQTQINHGWSDLFSTDLDAIFNIPLSHRVSLYVLGGGGGAIRRINLTQTVNSAGNFCNDWAGFCDIGFYPGDVLVDRKTTGRWEWNAGVGLNFAVGREESLFVEARYMEIETPVPTGFVPIRFGIML
jgi:hypothetical protein